MSVPLKPWEQGSSVQNRILNSSTSVSNFTTPGGRYRTAPALPPRPNAGGYGNSQYMGTNYNSSYAMCNNRPYSYNPYSNYGSYGYGGYGGGMMGGYGGFGGMYGNNYGYGYGAGAESRFIQLAEESTRPAFQSIESLVRAFGSISMMMDSTFFAITSSFRAVLGIAENFGRLRSMFGQFWSSFAIVRLLNWIYKKLLTLLGFKVPSNMGNEAWNQAVNGSLSETAPQGASWPIFVFLGVIVSAPYLISKLIPPAIDTRDPKNWSSPGAPARVAYEFVGGSPQELSVNAGEIIKIAPRSIQDEMQLGNSGWVFAASDRGTGIVPMNYIQPPMQKTSNETAGPSKQPMSSQPENIIENN